MLSITAKIIVAFTVVVTLALALFAFTIYRSTAAAELTKLDARLESHADKIMTELEEDADEHGGPDSASLASLRTEGLAGARFRLIAPGGSVVITDSVLDRFGGSGWEDAFRGFSRKDIFPFAEGRLRCMWVRAEVNDRYPFVIEIAAPMTEADANLRRLAILFMMIIPASVAALAFAAFGITRTAFRPIRGMIETARGITANDLHHRIALPRANDEVHLLAETLNSMIDRIEASFTAQRQFVADASHEIRTPLTVVCTELEFIAERLNDPALKESVQTSLAEVDRLAKLADDLLILARLDAPQLRLERGPMRVDELLLECIQRERSVAKKKNIEMLVEIRDQVEVTADREKLKSVFLNLLDNAIKYSPPAAIVTSRVWVERDGRSRLCASVSDTGPGIPSAELKNIFRRFYRVDRSRGETPGSGLGLAIVEKIVELHGGTVTALSDEGEGSTFTITFPLDSPA